MIFLDLNYNKVDHFKVKLRLPLVYHVGFSNKGDGEDGGEGDLDGDVRMILMVVWW